MWVVNNNLVLNETSYKKSLNINNGQCEGTVQQQTQNYNISITPVSQYCFNIDMSNEYGTTEGRGWVKGDGTELRLELYNNNNISITPAGHRCEDGPMGSKNASLTPDSEDCNGNFLVCSPASDPDYKNILIFDLEQ